MFPEGCPKWPEIFYKDRLVLTNPKFGNLHFIIGSFFDDNGVGFITSKIKHRETESVMISIVVIDCTERNRS